MTILAQSGEGHIKDRLYIYWDITTKCNYKCSYCYARHKYMPRKMWNFLPNDISRRVILASLKCSKLPIYLGLHGGEPLTHPDIKKLVYSTMGILKHELSVLYIATNLSTIKPIQELPYTDKIRILASFHPEFANPHEFVSRAISCSKKYKTKVNVLLHTDEQFWDGMQYVYDSCIDVGLNVHPHFIYDQVGDDEVLWSYSPEFYSRFGYMRQSPCRYEYTTDNGPELLSDVEVFERGLNHFKGWDCYNNNYEILIDGTVHKLCSSEYTSLFRNPLYFSKISRIDPMKCPFEVCSSDGVLKCLKIAPAS